MRLDAHYYSDIGGRSVNEDSAAYLQKAALCALAAADGLGGHGGGDVASQTVLALLEERFDALIPPSEESVRALIDEMNDAVLAKQTGSVKMKTTLALALLYDDSLCAAHVGDSRVYHFRGKEILYQSADHSVSQLAVLAGEITPDQIRFHEDRNRVLRAIGNEDGVRPDIRFFPHALQSGDALLTCTDGFWEYVTEDDMLFALKHTKTARDWLERMIKSVKKRAKSGNDNHSAVAVRVL